MRNIFYFLFSIFYFLIVPSLLSSIETKGYTVKTKIISDERMDVTFELKDYEITKVTRESRDFSRIKLKGAGLTEVTGKPELPTVTILFGMPSAGDFETVVKNINTVSKTIPFVYPVQSVSVGPTKGSKFEMDKYYGKSLFYPDAFYFSKEVGFFRDHRIGSILFYPFRYNPKKKTLKIIKKATFSIYFHKKENEKGTIRIPRRNSPGELLFSKLVINYEKSKFWLKRHPLPGPLKPRQSDNLYKIATDKEGLYQITYTDIVNAGIDPTTIIPDELHISHRGFEIPIYVKGEEDSVFNREDYIDFFAERIKGEETYFNPYTDENIYWLSFGDSLGKRMVEEDGTPSDSVNCIVSTSFWDTLHFEVDSLFVRFPLTTADSSDVWFWDRLDGPDTLIVNIFIPSPDTLINFDLSIMLHGYTTDIIGHKVNVYWNDIYYGQYTWSGQRPYNIKIENIPGELLKEGENTITFIVPQPPIDTLSNGKIIYHVDGIYTNWLEISYNHLLDAVDNNITFKTPTEIVDTTYEFRINNYDFADVEIYKRNVSKNINFKKEIYQEGGKTKYRFIFQDRDITGLMNFTVLPIWEKLKPLRIEKIELRDLHSTANRAEYLIITHNSLKSSAENYALWKETHGFNCMVATTDEIYNVFNDGIENPEAIRTFIKYAYDYYAEPPLYCLLFGDGTYDYKGLRGHSGNLVPVHLSWIRSPLWGPTADDEYFVRVSGDDHLPDIFIGRFPIRTDEEFDRIFEKIKIYADYQNLDEWKKDLVFVGDSAWYIDSLENVHVTYYSFPEMEKIIRDYLPPAFDASRCYHLRKNREDFLKEMDEGALFVNFLSHGGGDILCGGDFLISNDIYRMTNLDRMPFWTAFSCVNGFFAEPHPDSISIGETVFLAPNGGGIGYYGPGSLTYGGSNFNLSCKIFDGIFNERLLYLGQFLAYGEIEYFAASGNKNQLSTYNLLGDPGIKLALPDTTRIDLSLSPPSLSPGDTLTVQGFIHGSLQGEAVVTFFSIKDTAVTPFKKINASVSSGNFTASTAIPDTLSPGKGIVKVYFRGESKDGVGYEYYNIEQPNISSVQIIPEKPTREDSVYVTARIFDPDSVIQAGLKWKIASNWNEITMIPDTMDTFITASPIPPQSPDTTIEFKIYATDSFGNTDTSCIYSYHITALAELSFVTKNIYLDGDTIVEINVDVQNLGETAADSFRVGFFFITPETTISEISTYSIGKVSRRMSPDTISYDTLSLGIDSVKTATANFNLPFDLYSVYAIIDPDNWVEEGDESNNSSLDNPTYIWVDHFPVTQDSGTDGQVQSCDSVLYCSFPPNAVSSKTVLALKPDSMKKPILEPDISPVPINGDTTRAYSVTLSREVLTDSFLISFALDDSIISFPWLYLWLDDYNKWTTIGKALNDSIFYERKTRNTGLFSVFFNKDSIPPTITSRIENSDFKNGTVYEKKVRVTSVLTDKNGIDVVTRRINLVLNGDTVDFKDYSYSKNPSDSRAFPLKYSVELEDGSYFLIISAWDVNGNQGFDTLSFNVSIPFNIWGIGNYPNPVYLDSTIFTYHLTRDADEVVLKIFTSGGRLIKEFVKQSVPEGYDEIIWDLKDEEKNSVANGVYFYRFIARRKGEEKIETFKMAILR